jgi:nitroimidazol reductase NimA-like FMN-containing flavoprotein (pyridoxamine 5'-phosphate oxidase superfamily)
MMTTGREPQTPDTTTAAAGMPTDHRGLRVLTLPECLQRLGDCAVGRVGFVHDGDVVMFPVNHILDGVDIAFRTTWGSKLQQAADEGPLSFEVDGHDPVSRSGWSVLVQGRGGLVYDAEETRRMEERAGRSWLPEVDEPFWVRITALSVTGREIDRVGPDTGS